MSLSPTEEGAEAEVSRDQGLMLLINQIKRRAREEEVAEEGPTEEVLKEL